MKILITGAAGYIGAKLSAALVKKDWVEMVIGLDIKPGTLTHQKYQSIVRDIRQPLDDLFTDESIDTVAHLAYVLTPIHDQDLMEDINKGGTKNILQAAQKAGVQYFLYTSSATAYGFWPDNDIPLTEESPLRGNDDFTYAKNKKEIEAILAEFQTANPSMSLTILRPCFVVGPGFDNPLSRHISKKLVLLPTKTSPFQFVHEDDLLSIMLLFLKNKKQGVYNIAAPKTITFREMVKTLGNIQIPLPKSLMFALNDLAWRLRLTFLSEAPSPGLNMIVHPWLASSEKLVRDTGYQYQYDSREAFADFARVKRNSR